MFESSLDILDGIIKGLIIGVVVSAPMGPVGILIVQRTLNKGRWYGFITGVGAALSDLFYAVLCVIGISFVKPFCDDHRIALQIVGGVLLFFFGLYTYRTKPKTRLPHKPGKGKGTMSQNCLTGFLVTFSNPLIIFLLLMLFARFNFVTSHTLKLGMGFLAICAGALGWWLGLTHLINKVSSRFDENRIWRLNKTIGIVVMVVSLMSLFFTVTGRMLY